MIARIRWDEAMEDYNRVWKIVLKKLLSLNRSQINLQTPLASGLGNLLASQNSQLI